MPLVQLDTENADRDLTSLITVLTDTPDASNHILCQGYVILGDGSKDLDGTGGNFELVITIGGQTVQPSPQIVTFGTEARSAIWTTPFPVPSNTEVIMRVKSPNAADTDVDVTAYLFNLHQAIADVVWDEVLTGATHSVPSSAGRRLRQLEDVTLLAEGTAQAGDSGTITLEAGSSPIDDFYYHNMLVITSGTGVGQSRAIHSYAGGTLKATVMPAWKTNPDATSKYSIFAFGEVHVMEIIANGITAASFASGAFAALNDLSPAELAAALAGLNDLSADQINAEMVDVMRTDTVAELAAVPAKDAALHAMIQFVFLCIRNKVLTTRSTHTLRNDADDADIGSCAVGDDETTFTKGKMS